jgi:hypothetical protein
MGTNLIMGLPFSRHIPPSLSPVVLGYRNEVC